MPPFVPRKRRLSTPPPDCPTPKSAEKPTLFDTADKPRAAGTIQENKAFLDGLGNSDSDTTLSDVSSSEFEEERPTQGSSKRQKIAQHEEAEDEIDWEDAIPPDVPTSGPADAEPSGDLELTLDKSIRLGSLTNPHSTKKGPSKIERQIRMSTHCMHVQFLLFHNSVRNAWVCDKEVQSILVGQLPPGVKKEIEKWKLASGMAGDEVERVSQLTSRGNGKRKGGKAAGIARSQRDWGKPAERQERGVPNMSRGDPVIRLLKVLAAYWRKRFTITAPGLRKQGYKPLAVLETEVAAFQNDKHDSEEHGERIDNLKAFRRHARDSVGSRDVGAQLFTALVRGLGLEARLIASLQPIGYGWSKTEEAVTKRKKPLKTAQTAPNGTAKSSDSGEDWSQDGSDEEDTAVRSTVKKPSSKPAAASKKASAGKSRRKGGKDAVIDLEDSSELSNALNKGENSDDDSVVDVTPLTPRKRPHKYYDRDMPFPVYWTEIISPITHEIIPVDSLILIPPVATNPELLASFEPRGARSDKAKIVFAYVVAFSSDGSGKDVTTRYLKRHMWPGKTKSVRVPIEKVPLYNKKGKIKYYEEYDWFKTVMSGYTRTYKMRTIVDDLEESKDLQSMKPEKKEIRAGEETLQGYKNSAEFVLERHLRREEALLPSAIPVKMFVSGKGDKATEEPVFRRDDVMICRTGESWHKEGRKIKPGECPMKMVPVRAVTLTRKREVEEAERDGGEKLKQGLYAWNQTEWIIPPPIENGVIPKNAFGNMDCYVPTMVPKGAVHIPLKGTVKICKRLGIDYAEAVTGFEFGKQRAVPVVTGVVVAAEHEPLMIDEWEKDEEERRKKEEGKREKVALHLWRKFLMGLRIIERVREEYGGDADAHMKEEINPFTNKNKKANVPKPGKYQADSTNRTPVHFGDQDAAGGFLPDADKSSGDDFLLPEHEEEIPRPQSGGFIIEDEAPPMGLITSLASPRAKLPSESGVHKDRSTITDNDEQPTHEQIPKITKAPRKDPNEKSKATKSTKTKSQPPQYPGNSATSVPSDDALPSDPLVCSPPHVTKRSKAGRKPEAARKSEGAVKSIYFAHDSEDADDSGGESAGDTEDVAYKPTTKAKLQSNVERNGHMTNSSTRRSNRKTM
ncbi:hypothetical protein MMC08_000644 [Hypocenomyce scalaris]|nr:hypothetical protein [Hypocenomyce scalaris]